MASVFALWCYWVQPAILAFAQTSSFGQAAQGIATEMIAIAKMRRTALSMNMYS